jgi:hypothetical protein
MITRYYSSSSAEGYRTVGKAAGFLHLGLSYTSATGITLANHVNVRLIFGSSTILL